MKKFSVKSWLSNITESVNGTSETPDVSPENFDYVSDFKIKPAKNVIDIHFVTKDKKELELKIKDSAFKKWMKQNPENGKSQISKFVLWFLTNHHAHEANMVSEIVDEYNGLIGDEDVPKDNSQMIGLYSKDSTQASYQTLARPRAQFNTGAISGFISW